MRKLTLLIFLFIIAIHVHAQDGSPAPKGFQKDKLFLGGNFGLTFGDYTLINVSPQLGYRFNHLFAAGLGVNGQYVSIKQKDIYGNLYSKSTLGVVGLNIFGRIYPIPQIMLQAQPEANYIFGKDVYYTGSPTGAYKRDTQIIPSLLLGGGGVLPAGRGATIISVFYDVLQNVNSPYGKKPIFNIGYNINL